MELLVVHVSEACSELAADVLRVAGVGALEERFVGSGSGRVVELRLAAGEIPEPTVVEALRRITEIDAAARWATESVGDSALASWRNFAGPLPVADGWTIVPSWREDVVRSVEPTRAILIDPGTVFGMGDHPSTLGMLRAIHAECGASTEVRRMVDAGSGSGILAVFAALVHGVDARGYDIAPDAARIAGCNARANGVEDRVSIIEGPELIDDAWADLVVANIGAATLLEMRTSLCRMVRPGGRIILGGIREHQLDAVIDGYARCAPEVVNVDAGWCTLVLRRPETAPR